MFGEKEGSIKVMQSNPNRVTSNPLRLKGRDTELTVVTRTPNGRMFHCCDKVCGSGKHGKYSVPKLRYKHSRRDHGSDSIRFM